MSKLLPKEIIKRYADVVSFILVGITASAVHGAVSWWVYYHGLGWQSGLNASSLTLFSTLAGYAFGWPTSYLGNRYLSFHKQAKHTSVTTSAAKFVVSQLVSMAVLLSSTWLVQQAIMLYFYWYMITNNIQETPELVFFSRGASYPPALVVGMMLAAVASYMMMRHIVFKSRTQSAA